MDSKKSLTILLIVAVVALLGFALWQFGGSRSSINSGLSTAPAASSLAVEEVLGRQYIDDLNSLENLNMDMAFFSNPGGDNPDGDPVFRSLVDRHKELPREPVGRDNPFLPINDAQILQAVKPTP
ncbi:MAG: hypothetical protein HZA94_02600 [Candidatus Vogelbacteria bacterium]|nr:hypothetical protein [Candidatus Vogelbacteria bacterium]